jgi:hypothetical protein
MVNISNYRSSGAEEVDAGADPLDSVDGVLDVSYAADDEVTVVTVGSGTYAFKASDKFTRPEPPSRPCGRGSHRR